MHKSSKRLFRADQHWPAHVSVGAVLVNERREVAFHYYPRTALGEIYLLMRETLENGETLEAGVARGLQEEWGATGEIMAFLGSTYGEFREELLCNGRLMRKTTLYFLIKLVAIDHAKRRADDPERHSQTVWLPLERAINQARAQAGRLPHRPDFDETAPLFWAQQYLDAITKLEAG